MPLTLLMSVDAFENKVNEPIGRRSAGSSFLDAYFQYGGNIVHSIVPRNNDDFEWFQQKANIINSNSLIKARGLRNWGLAAKETGIFHLADPNLPMWAWRRMPYGDGSFSLLGIIHTLSANNVQKTLSEFSSAPLRHWDALICTSSAGKKVVEGFLERQESYLRWRHGATSFERPHLYRIAVLLVSSQ